MKIRGQKPSRATKVITVGDNIQFTIQAVLDGGEFEKLCPAPQPPYRTHKNGEVERNVNSPEYQKAIAEHASKQTHYLIIKALEASDNEITWDRVKVDDSSTWKEVESELKEILTSIQYGQLLTEIFQLNSLNQVSL